MGMIIQNGKLFSGEPKTTYTERVLWSGPATPSTSGSDITLSDDITNYDEIVFDLTSETGRKYQDNYFVSSLTIGSTYLEALYAAESQGVFWTYTNETSINIKRITTGKETAITYNKIIGIKYGDTVKRKDYHVYSTEEKIVGEWIDGKPLYEKTLKVGTTSSTSEQYFETNILSADVDIYFIKESFIITGTGLAWTTGGSNDSFFHILFLSNATTNLRVSSRVSSNAMYGNLYVTIRYTKSST
jgi:hypothetical protein